jgi:HK97 gp10 family phage protein
MLGHQSMSMRITVQVDYAAQLARILQEEFPNALDTKIQEAILEVGNEMKIMAAQLAPVRTGYLRSTISLGQDSPAKWEFTLLARAPYAVYVEFGTRRMAPRYFMTHSVEAYRASMLEAVQNATIQTIQESLRR